MELTKNIFFNTDKLVENSTVKIFYTGQFFESRSEEVYIHYGFGLLWEHANEKKMELTEFGYEAEIDIFSADTFNFCFRNQDNEWDNNLFQNYCFDIERSDSALITVDIPEFLAEHKGLTRSYIWSKKIRLAIYKILTFVPKLLSGNYKRAKAE